MKEPLVWPAFFIAGLNIGGFVAARVGPLTWRAYQLAVALFFLRAAYVIWRRLDLPVLATNMLFAAAFFLWSATLPNHDAAVAAFGAKLFLPSLLFVLGLGWLSVLEFRRAPAQREAFRQYLGSVPFRDRFFWRNAPDIRAQGNHGSR